MACLFKMTQLSKDSAGYCPQAPEWVLRLVYEHVDVTVSLSRSWMRLSKAS
jgi:hypothetical protein